MTCIRIVVALCAVLAAILPAPATASEEIAAGDTLQAIVREARDQMQPVAAQRHVQCRIDVRGDSLVAPEDLATMRESVLNMLANALVSAPRGGIVSLTADPSTHQLTVWVSDPGTRLTLEREVCDATGRAFHVRLVAGRGMELRGSLVEAGLGQVP